MKIRPAVTLWHESELSSQDLPFPTVVGAGANLGAQLIGIAAMCTFAFSLVTFGILKATIGVRVDEEEELKGPGLTEHGVAAYGIESA